MQQGLHIVHLQDAEPRSLAVVHACQVCSAAAALALEMGLYRHVHVLTCAH